MMKQETDDGESLAGESLEEPLEIIFETTPIVVVVVYSPIYEYSRDYLTFIAIIKDILSAEYDSDIVKFVYLDIGFKDIVMLGPLSGDSGNNNRGEELTKDEQIRLALLSKIVKIPEVQIYYFGNLHSKFVGLCTLPKIRECLNSLL